MLECHVISFQRFIFQYRMGYYKNCSLASAFCKEFKVEDEELLRLLEGENDDTDALKIIYNKVIIN